MQLFPAEMQDEISLNASFQWKLGVCVYYSSCSSLIKPRTWLFMFLKPSKPINHQVIKTVKPKPYESNPCERKKKSNPCEKKSNPSNLAIDQTIKPSKRNRSNGSSQESIKNQTQQTQPIKPSNPTTDQPIHHHWVPINPSNPSPINPSTTTEFRSTHQTPHRSTHPPPPSSQIKPTADQPIKPTVDQPIHHHRVPKSRN